MTIKAKPMGAIPPGFGTDAHGVMTIHGHNVRDLIEAAGDTPLFVYDPALIKERIAALRAALPQAVSIHYAIKANPFGPLLARMAEWVDGFDIASGGELQVALAAGLSPSAISFAGPGKRDRELAAALRSGVTINLESAGEADRALALAQQLDVTPRLAVRVNPEFDLKGSGMRMGGGAKPFGVDAADAAALVRHIIAADADWRGWHIFAGSQALDADAIADTQAQTVALAAALSRDVGATPPMVNLGGGLGVPYFHGDTPVDAAAIGQKLSATLDARDPVLADSHFAMELGRYLVAEAGVYLTRVVDRKVSHGETFLVTDGGLHHQLAASGNFGTVVRRNYPLANASRFGTAEREVAHVVGCLCTPLDKLGDAVEVAPTDVGDLIAVFMAGAYGATASPERFLGQGAAREILAD